MRIGTMRMMPLAQMLHTITTMTATKAMSQLPEVLAQLVRAEPDRVRPIAMMMGPVTTGGKKRITLFVPNHLMRPARTRYSNPAQNTPRQAYVNATLCVMPFSAPNAVTVA